MKVGVRDLKARLSDYLARVERGEVIDVTSRGWRVARIVPPTTHDPIAHGLAAGWLTRGSVRPPSHVVPLAPRPGTPTTTELIRADRDA
jgi:prevent-host-death family protein